MKIEFFHRIFRLVSSGILALFWRYIYSVINFGEIHYFLAIVE